MFGLSRTTDKLTTDEQIPLPQVLQTFRHKPYLITIHYAFQTHDKLAVVMDYVAGGDLGRQLYTNNVYDGQPVDAVRLHIAELVLAVEQLHELQFMHRDLRLEHVLLGADGHIKVTGFRYSKQESLGGEQPLTGYGGPVDNMAPELFIWHNDQDNRSVDWWSIGVMTFELLTKSKPFAIDVAGAADRRAIGQRMWKATLVLPAELPADARDFIKRMLHKDLRLRLQGYAQNAVKIKAHAFFRSIDWTALAEGRVEAPFRPAIDDEMDESKVSSEKTSVVEGAVGGDLYAEYEEYSFMGAELRVPKPRVVVPAAVAAPAAVEEAAAAAEEEGAAAWPAVLPVEFARPATVVAWPTALAATQPAAVAALPALLRTKPKDVQTLIANIPKVSA